MIARDGYPFILIGLVVTVIVILLATKWDSSWLFALAVIFGVLTLFTTYFFRDPDRTVAITPGILVSPADGKIIGIDTLDVHPYIGGPAVKISIFLNVFDVHVNRIPADGRIEYVKYNPGKFFAAFADKASELNEQTEIGMTSAQGTKIVFKQIAGLIARRIICRLKPDQIVTAGERFGMIRFGSRTELYVPAGSKIDVKVGDRVAGGKSVIGYLAPGVSSSVAPTGLESERK